MRIKPKNLFILSITKIKQIDMSFPKPINISGSLTIGKEIHSIEELYIKLQDEGFAARGKGNTWIKNFDIGEQQYPLSHCPFNISVEENTIVLGTILPVLVLKDINGLKIGDDTITEVEDGEVLNFEMLNSTDPIYNRGFWQTELEKHGEKVIEQWIDFAGEYD